jgi:hypothetical protein
MHPESGQEAILAAAKLQSISDFGRDDIFIAGYPKSGNTWMQCLIAGVLFGLDTRLTPDSLVQTLVPDTHLQKFYKRFLTPTFFKTHSLPQSAYKKVIYLARDGRDVMVSYFHFLSAFGNRPAFLELVTTGQGLFPCRWHEHVETWMANPHSAQMMVVRYEALKRDPVPVLEEICHFADLERERSLLEKVAQNSTFEAMRERERELGWENAAWPRDKAFMRRGVVSSFQDEMPQPVLQAFMASALPAMKLLGYC